MPEVEFTVFVVDVRIYYVLVIYKCSSQEQSIANLMDRRESTSVSSSIFFTGRFLSVNRIKKKNATYNRKMRKRKEMARE
jgi:hypothetical protein